MKTGIHEGLTMEAYLALPAASASLMRALLDRCPLAAWHGSWLNPAYRPYTNRAMDRGTIAHGILLEGSTDGVAVFNPVDFTGPRGGVPKGWTNDEIKAARDAAIAAGKVPVLKDDMQAIVDQVDAARAFIDNLKATEPAIWAAFQPGGGDSELTMVWQDGPTLCKMRPDRISKDRRLIVDYKGTGRSAEPNSWGRTQFTGMGYYLSSAWYRRGTAALCGTEPAYVFLAQETEPPYLCSLVGTDPHAFALGADKVETALELWAHCVKTGKFPGYPANVCYPEIPAWVDTQWEEFRTTHDELQQREGLQA
jgi:hypothetical protein